jgi:hypothetical protein
MPRAKIEIAMGGALQVKLVVEFFDRLWDGITVNKIELIQVGNHCFSLS